MGAISAADDGEGVNSPSEQYYGNSSAASFMRLARDSMPIRSYMQALKNADNSNPSAPSFDSGLWRDLNPSAANSEFQFNDFSLPPRNLADHLLECFWERFYCLYPFFHRPSFEQAYESLWGAAKWPRTELPELNIGLGGSYDSGPQSIVFHCALNAIFALGCHFSDIPIREREAQAYSFSFVQTLLIIALLLQSTPYSNRCWNAIGLACRVAQGLGLHEATAQRNHKPLEQEIRRRTWYGCVMMDMIVSMTYGRPSMTSHISPVHAVPLPAMRPKSQSEDPCALSEQPCDHSQGQTIFYASTIELYTILESILADVYNAWRGRSHHNRTPPIQETSPTSLDVVMELDNKLANFEANVPSVLNWTNSDPSDAEYQLPVFRRQRNVLRARFIHLRLLLYRPMFTQLCSEERTGPTKAPSTSSQQTSRTKKNFIYDSILVNCAAACVNAAIDLVSLMHETYLTSHTDAWWYNGFYTSTAGFVLIMSYSCRSILKQIDTQVIAETWRKCEEVLTHMAAFSLSARNSLQFLQVTHQHIIQNYTKLDVWDSGEHPPGTPSQRHRMQPRDRTADPAEITVNLPESQNMQDSDVGGRPMNPFMSLDEMDMRQEEFGFLGRFDVPDLASWFPDLPDVSE
ncbi:hypothetical protein N7468_005971 [Penicillium chermesinum]|uniref:Xylanolytic transcriptional activator regulatory domain-containing protein n=1 Tax=Penicillium chermesinum TaxID=63820 RepID=A0A9W9P0F6_9EURO|nr:uncharacterized protein N7468_005971 [Penicillium chermesinum]KAJ5233015.1 hypothetical protein N7468_005971 [Penicillium chermesinum]